MGLVQEQKGKFLIKVCEIRYAKIQGKFELEKHVRSYGMNFDQENKQSFVLSLNKLVSIEELIMKQKKENV